MAFPAIEEFFENPHEKSLFSKSFRNQNTRRCHGNGRTQIYYWRRSHPGWWCHHSLAALILVHASPRRTDRHVVLCDLHKLEKAGDECGRVLRICVVQMMCLLCNAALPGITAQVQMMSEARLKGFILLQSTFRIQCVLTQVLFHVNGSAGEKLLYAFAVRYRNKQWAPKVW